jgi:hypothetical protein
MVCTIGHIAIIEHSESGKLWFTSVYLFVLDESCGSLGRCMIFAYETHEFSGKGREEIIEKRIKLSRRKGKGCMLKSCALCFACLMG